MPNGANASRRPPRPRLYGNTAAGHPKAQKNWALRTEWTPPRPPLNATDDTTSPVKAAMSSVTAHFRSPSMRGSASRRSSAGMRSTFSGKASTFTSRVRGSDGSRLFF